MTIACFGHHILAIRMLNSETDQTKVPRSTVKNLNLEGERSIFTSVVLPFLEDPANSDFFQDTVLPDLIQYLRKAASLDTALVERPDREPIILSWFYESELLFKQIIPSIRRSLKIGGNDLVSAIIGYLKCRYVIFCEILESYSLGIPMLMEQGLTWYDTRQDHSGHLDVKDVPSHHIYECFFRGELDVVLAKLLRLNEEGLSHQLFEEITDGLPEIFGLYVEHHRELSTFSDSDMTADWSTYFTTIVRSVNSSDDVFTLKNAMQRAINQTGKLSHLWRILDSISLSKALDVSDMEFAVILIENISSDSLGNIREFIQQGYLIDSEERRAFIQILEILRKQVGFFDESQIIGVLSDLSKTSDSSQSMVKLNDALSLMTEGRNEISYEHLAPIQFLHEAIKRCETLGHHINASAWLEKFSKIYMNLKSNIPLDNERFRTQAVTLAMSSPLCRLLQLAPTEKTIEEILEDFNVAATRYVNSTKSDDYATRAFSVPALLDETYDGELLLIESGVVFNFDPYLHDSFFDFLEQYLDDRAETGDEGVEVKITREELIEEGFLHQF